MWWVRRGIRMINPCISRGIFLVLGLNLFIEPSWGADFSNDISEYAIDVWQVDEGLPQISVTSIAQTGDGYLWLGTFNGLACFDGVRFKVFDEGNTPALGSSRIIQVLVDSEGGLWIVTEAGGLSRMIGGQFKAYTMAEGLPDSGVAFVARDAANRLILVDREYYLHRIEGGRLVPPASNEGLEVGHETSLLFQGNGFVWIIKQGKATRSFQQSVSLPMRSDTQAASADLVITCGVPSRSGGYWLAASTGLYRYQDGAIQSRLAPLPEGVGRLELMTEDHQGHCWAGTWREGVFRWDADRGWRRFDASAGMADNHLNFLLTDREGNLWAGTGQGGLHRFKPRLFQMYDTRNGMAGNVVTSVSEDRQGRMWIGVNGGGLHCWESGRMFRVTEPASLLEYPLVYSVLAEGKGAVWVGIYGRTALRVFQGAVTPFHLKETADPATPWALFESRAGEIWLGTESGLMRYADGRFKHYARQHGLSHHDVRALAEDRSGTLYIGTGGGGLNCLTGERFTCYTERDGLADDDIFALCVDGDGAVWIGTANGGLSRFKEGRFANLTMEDGLPSNTIGSLLEDNQDNLWLGSNRGLIRVSRRELNEYLLDRRRLPVWQVFNRSDGLNSIDTCGVGQPACQRASDGRLWFATVKGVAVVDPARLPHNPLPPSVVIEEVLLEDQLYDLQRPKSDVHRLGETVSSKSFATELRTAGAQPASMEDSRPPVIVTVPPRTQRVEFRFTGLSLVAPEKVRFRYRLEGLEDDWVEGGFRRMASYTRLPPGRYRFCVTACNNDGVWNEDGAFLAVLVLPAWWQTWWFRAAAFLGVSGLAGWGVEMRMRRLKRDQIAQQAFSRRLLESQEAERKRIAAELHDSLGQDLLVIKNRAILGLQNPALIAPAMEQLGEISTMASHALEEVREISRNLRPYQLDRLGLTKALQAMATGISRASGMPIVTELDAIEGLVDPSLEIHLYRIMQELLNNVVKHSQASVARFTVKHQGLKINLVVEDDGRGFDTVHVDQPSASHGMGLTDVVERIRLLGGVWRCDSRQAAGTRWTIEIPAAREQTV